jgi:hypothetical protein
MRHAAMGLTLVLGTMGCQGAPVERETGAPRVAIRMAETPLSDLRGPLRVRVFDSTAGLVAGLACDRGRGIMVPVAPGGRPIASGGPNSVAAVPGGAVDPQTRCASGTRSSSEIDECIATHGDESIDVPMWVYEGDYFILVEGAGVLPDGSTGVLGSGCDWVSIDAAHPPAAGSVMEILVHRQP